MNTEYSVFRIQRDIVHKLDCIEITMVPLTVVKADSLSGALKAAKKKYPFIPHQLCVEPKRVKHETH